MPDETMVERRRQLKKDLREARIMGDMDLARELKEELSDLNIQLGLVA